MRKLSTALCVALFALSGTASYAADEKKAEPAKQTTAKPADKAASAARRGLGSGQEEGEEGRLLTRAGTAGSNGEGAGLPRFSFQRGVILKLPSLATSMSLFRNAAL